MKRVLVVAVLAMTVFASSATLRFTGREIAWVAPVGPHKGVARVYVDGRYVGRVSLFARIGSPRMLVFSRAWSSSAIHTVRIVNEGTAGRPRIDIDGFVVRR